LGTAFLKKRIRMDEKITPLECDPTTTPVPVTVDQEWMFSSREIARMQGIQPLEPVLPIVTTFRGRLDLAVLGRALSGLVLRHPALRTEFLPSNIKKYERHQRLRAFARTGVLQPGLYCQTLAPATPLPLPVTDIRHLSEKDRLATLDQAFERECSRPFDAPPRLRAHLYVTGTGESVLQMLVDRTVCDVWSVGILRRELLELYETLRDSNSPEVRQTAINFLDYAAWERGHMEDGYFDKAAEYWRAQWVEFGNARITPAEMPYSITPSQSPVPQLRPRDPGFACFVERRDDLVSAIKAFGSKHRCSVNSVWLAAFAILMHQYTGREKLGLLGHFANRSHPETESVVGWFSTSHLVGVDVPKEARIGTVIAGISRRVADAIIHQQISEHLLWWRLNCVPRVRGVQPILETYTYAVHRPVSLSGELRVAPCPTPAPVGGRVSQFGAYVICGGYRAAITAQTSLTFFSKDAAEALAKDLVNTVEELIDVGAEGRVGDLDTAETLGRHEAAAVAREEMSEFLVFDPGLIPEIRPRSADSI